jgi:hypothetical protein
MIDFDHQSSFSGKTKLMEKTVRKKQAASAASQR